MPPRAVRAACAQCIRQSVPEPSSVDLTLPAYVRASSACCTGSVLLDDVDISQLEPKWFHRKVALVGQEPTLVSRAARGESAAACRCQTLFTWPLYLALLPDPLT